MIKDEVGLEYCFTLAAIFLETAEGFRSLPYKDKVGKITNGYGNTRITPNVAVTVVKARLDLHTNLQFFHSEIVARVPLAQIYLMEQHEYAAILCFAFNVGVGNFQVWQLMKAGKFDAIPAQLMRFTHGHIDGKLVKIQGLVNRRKAEVTLYETKDLPTEAIPAEAIKVVPAPNASKVEQANKAITVAASSAPVTAAVATVGKHPSYLPFIIFGLIVLALIFVLIDDFRVRAKLNEAEGKTNKAAPLQSKSQDKTT